MKSTAQQIADLAGNAAEAVALANMAPAVGELDWGTQTTSYTFADGSCLFVSGPDFVAATWAYRIHVRRSSGAAWMPMAARPGEPEFFPSGPLAQIAMNERAARDSAAGEHWEYLVVRMPGAADSETAVQA